MGWTFLTNYAHVLICLASAQDMTLKDVATRVGITERGVYRIVNQLVREGALKRTRRGRRNHYEILVDFKLRHPLEQHCSVAQLLSVLGRGRPRRSR